MNKSKTMRRNQWAIIADTKIVVIKQKTSDTPLRVKQVSVAQ